MDEARRMITEQYVSGKITREEFEEKKKLINNIPEESRGIIDKKPESESADITFQSCILWGFIISIFFLLLLMLFLISQGFFLSGATPMVAIVMALIGIIFLTFIIFAPIIYVIRKVLIPKLKEFF